MVEMSVRAHSPGVAALAEGISAIHRVSSHVFFKDDNTKDYGIVVVIDRNARQRKWKVGRVA